MWDVMILVHAYYVSDEKRRGAHWAVLVIDLKNGAIYYGDSLALVTSPIQLDQT